MQRRLLNLLTALSLLLPVATAGLWVRSYWRADCVSVWNSRGRLSAETRVGYLSVEKSNMWGESLTGYWLVSAVGPAAQERSAIRRWVTRGFLGFFYATDTRPGQNIGLFPELTDRGLRTPAGLCRRDEVYAAFWALCPLSALPAVLLLWRRQVPRRRRARGLCPACGYDLRASPGPCPECGAPAGATSA